MNCSLRVPSFAGYFKNLAATAYKIYQAELIIFARFVYTSQKIFKHSEQTTYNTYIQHYMMVKYLVQLKNPLPLSKGGTPPPRAGISGIRIA